MWTPKESRRSAWVDFTLYCYSGAIQATLLFTGNAAVRLCGNKCPAFRHFHYYITQLKLLRIKRMSVFIVRRLFCLIAQWQVVQDNGIYMQAAWSGVILACLPSSNRNTHADPVPRNMVGYLRGFAGRTVLFSTV